MKKFFTIFAIAILGILMVFTTPDKKTHKKAMMEAIKDYVDEEAEERLGDNILADLSKTLANNSIKAVLNYKLRLHDYYLFNTTTIHMDGKDQLTSVGILGHVFTFDKEMLEKRLEKAADLKED